MNKIKPLYLIALLGGIAIVFYLSWLPDPNIGYKPYFPKWLGKWTNAHGNLRTAVPFVFLGLTGEIFQFKSQVQSWKRRITLLTILALIVSLAEAGQLFIPKRHFDTGDIMWGIAGAATGIVLGMATTKILEFRGNLKEIN